MLKKYTAHLLGFAAKVELTPENNSPGLESWVIVRIMLQDNAAISVISFQKER